LGWLVGAAGGYYIMQTLLEALIEVYLPDYLFSNWQATLVMMAFVVVTVLFNTLGARLLPLVETISLVGHVAGWIITIVVLWVLAPKNSAHEVFGEVINNGGWSNTGLSCLVGSITILYAQLGKIGSQAVVLLALSTSANTCPVGPDAAVHIGKARTSFSLSGADYNTQPRRSEMLRLCCRNVWFGGIFTTRS
jgi:amino acid transporter